MERWFQLIEKLVAELRYVWVRFRVALLLVYAQKRGQWTYSWVVPKLLHVAPVLRVLSGMGASSVIPLTKRILQRRPRAKYTRATGRWTLARHGADSLTPLDSILNKFTDKRR